ncbi:hypothetical protein L7F22_063634 [Adiantum nelumboides]|nr:hypothetical protein [Adiantum nelumboides]
MDMTNIDAEKPLLPIRKLQSSTTAWLRQSISFIATHFKDIALVVGPIVFVILYFTVDIDDDTGKTGPMLAAMAWMFIWWVAEAVPLAVTALVPLFLFPLLEIQTASSVSKSYTNDTIFLILGSFILANAVRFHNLHKRLALHIVLMFGSDPRLLLFGFCIGSAFISMWVDNAAAAAMLMPMAVSVQQKVHAGFQLQGGGSANYPPGDFENPSQSLQEHEEKNDTPSPLERKTSLCLEKHLSNVLTNMTAEDALKIELDFCRGVAISVAISVTIGGMSTLTGNSVNLILSGLWETDFPKERVIYYMQWMLFAVPFAIIVLLALWALLCIFFCPPSAVKPVSASLHSLHLEDELARLGPMTSDQIAILLIFLVLIVFWMTKSLTGNVSGWAALFDDYPANGSVTILMAIVLFVLPNPADLNQKLMNWSQCKDIPWNIILLVGGGFALADGIKASGLSDVISEEMTLLKSLPYWAITPTIALVTGIVTEFTSNSATASIFVPLMAEIALSIDEHPLFLMVPAALGSQLSYMFPTATGPNAMAFAIEALRVKDMAVPGFFLKIIAIVVLSIFMPTLGVLIFNTNSSVQT